MFDEIKNKLTEKKACATSLVAEAVQGQLVALPHNLLLLSYEHRLEREPGVTNQAEDRRREQHLEEDGWRARLAGRILSPLLASVRRTTQRSVKFVRWLLQILRENLSEAGAVPRLTHLYASQ